LVCFVNDLPLLVIELKNPGVLARGAFDETRSVNSIVGAAANTQGRSEFRAGICKLLNIL